MHPIPDYGGVYAGMWVQSSSQALPLYREGMYGSISLIPHDSGPYEFTFWLARLDTSVTSGDVEIGIYGIYNPLSTYGTQPTSMTEPTNLELFGIGNTVLLGVITVPSTKNNTWVQQQPISFNSNMSGFPADGITHIMITRNDGSLNSSWRKMYLAFDNFCMQIDTDTTGTGCRNCCDHFKIDVKSSVYESNSEWFVSANLTTGPNDIIEIKANLVNFYMNEQPGCERCVDQDIDMGSIVPCNDPKTQIDWNPNSSPSLLVSPTTTCSYPSPRELVWNNIVDDLYTSRPPLNNEDILMKLVIPPPHTFQGTCCFDKIWFCIRWTFTDDQCITCDTLTCFRFNVGGSAPPIELEPTPERQKR